MPMDVVNFSYSQTTAKPKNSCNKIVSKILDGLNNSCKSFRDIPHKCCITMDDNGCIYFLKNMHILLYNNKIGVVRKALCIS